MDAVVVAAQVIRKFTGEEIKLATAVGFKGLLRDVVVLTQSKQKFTVTVNIAGPNVGHFFEGSDPIRAHLRNFHIEGDVSVVLE